MDMWTIEIKTPSGGAGFLEIDKSVAGHGQQAIEVVMYELKPIVEALVRLEDGGRKD